MFIAEGEQKGLREQLGGILEAMLEAYANGDEEAIIFVHSGKAIALVDEYTKNWPNAKKNSETSEEGTETNYMLQRRHHKTDLEYDEERAILQMIVGFRRSMPIILKRIIGQEENPLYALQFHATEIFQ